MSGESYFKLRAVLIETEESHLICHLAFHTSSNQWTWDTKAKYFLGMLYLKDDFSLKEKKEVSNCSRKSLRSYSDYTNLEIKTVGVPPYSAADKWLGWEYLALDGNCSGKVQKHWVSAIRSGDWELGLSF